MTGHQHKARTVPGYPSFTHSHQMAQGAAPQYTTTIPGHSSRATSLYPCLLSFALTYILFTDAIRPHSLNILYSTSVSTTLILSILPSVTIRNTASVSTFVSSSTRVLSDRSSRRTTKSAEMAPLASSALKCRSRRHLDTNDLSTTNPGGKSILAIRGTKQSDGLHCRLSLLPFIHPSLVTCSSLHIMAPEDSSSATVCNCCWTSHITIAESPTHAPQKTDRHHVNRLLTRLFRESRAVL
jgi:hypothetical protein